MSIETEAKVTMDAEWMSKALTLAQLAAKAGEVPVGAVVVRDNALLGEGFNLPISGCDPTAHAEIIALREAAKKSSNYRLPGATLYVTIEPCTMCLGAIVHARIARVVFGASEPKAGVLQSNPSHLNSGIFNHCFEWSGGVCESESAALIQQFFAERREKKKALKQNASSRN